MPAWDVTVGKRLSRSCGICRKTGDLVVVPFQHTISRGAMHILETHKGLVLIDHVIVRYKSSGIW